MVVVAQLVRVLVCGAEGRRFEPGQPPRMQKASRKLEAFFVFILYSKKFVLFYSLIGLSAKIIKYNPTNIKGILNHCPVENKPNASSNPL